MKIAVVGAGIAGLALCEHLSNGLNNITLFDSNDPLMASRAPTMLLHPFPGRSLEPHSLLNKAVTEAVELIERWKLIAPRAVRSQKIIRPIKLNNRLWKSFARHWRGAPDQWASVKLQSQDLEEYSCFSQGIQDGVLVCTPAYAVDMDLLRKSLIKNLQHRGVEYKQQEISHVTRRSDKLYVQTQAAFDRVILAMGSTTLDWFPDAQLTVQGGSLLKIPISEPLPYLLSINGLHLGAHQDGDWVIGSTRWAEKPTASVEKEDIFSRLSPICRATPTVGSGKLWSGIRCIYPSDRLPLCGELPHQKGVFVLTALGSKGLLWGPLAAKLLCNNVCFGSPISPALSLLRASAYDGWFSPRVL